MSDLIIQNPVSIIGAARRIWPLGRGSYGWRSAARWTGAALLPLCAWICVLAVYALLCVLPILWIPWGIYTLRRRHFVYDARRYGKPIDEYTR
jgi:hypothetical protein